MPANWTAIEDAIRAWVKTGSGLADAKVIWADQTGARPAGPFVTIRIGDLLALGAVDEVEELTDLGRPAGQEVEQRVVGLREFPVSVQAFGPAVAGAGTAREYLSKVQTALALPSVRDALEAAGVSSFDQGVVRTVNELVGTKYEGRAILECRFYLLESVSEFSGYIETVEATSYMGPPLGPGTKDGIDIP